MSITKFIYANLSAPYAFQLIGTNIWLFRKNTDGENFDWDHGIKVSQLAGEEYDLLKGFGGDELQLALEQVERCVFQQYRFPDETISTDRDIPTPTSEVLQQHIVIVNRMLRDESSTLVVTKGDHKGEVIISGLDERDREYLWKPYDPNNSSYCTPEVLTPDEDAVFKHLGLTHNHIVEDVIR